MKRLIIIGIILLFSGIVNAEEKVTYNSLTELVETTFRLGVVWGHRLTLEKFNIPDNEQDKSGTTLPSSQTFSPQMDIEKDIIEKALRENREWIRGAKEVGK
ncbi:MAG: hypothetical protein PHC68_00525 [Syntrophorhabdaceae bacterium]|nr:hypothetical protein [Syntrophorhabdaceae bacterium]